MKTKLLYSIRIPDLDKGKLELSEKARYVLNTSIDSISEYYVKEIGFKNDFVKYRLESFFNMVYSNAGIDDIGLLIVLSDGQKFADKLYKLNDYHDSLKLIDIDAKYPMKNSAILIYYIMNFINEFKELPAVVNKTMSSNNFVDFIIKS